MAADSTERPLPGGQPLAREFIALHQRARIIDGLVQEVSEKGYGAVTVAHIVKRARVSRNTFYENFRSKEECFLAAQEYAMSTALEQVTAAAEELDRWPQRVAAGMDAFLRFVVERPALARTCMVEALAAGPASVASYEKSLQAFVSLFKLGRGVSSRAKELPETLEEALVGGIFWILYQRLLLGEIDEIEELLPELLEFALAPYLGTDSARAIAAEKQKTGQLASSSSHRLDRYRRVS